MDGEDPLSVARMKIRVWKREVAERLASPIALHDGVDLTLHPSEPRASFPGLVPFRVLTAADVVFGKDSIVSVPSIAVTAMVSAAVGVVVTLLAWAAPLMWKLQRGVRKAASDVVRNGRGHPSGSSRLAHLRTVLGSIVNLLRVAVCITMGLWYKRFLDSRRPQVLSISRYTDVSGTPDRGPCVVADRVLMMTNSHAGTHADMPPHFIHCAPSLSPSAIAPPARLLSAYPAPSPHMFDEAHYSGDALIVDVSQELSELSFDTNALTVEVVDRAINRLPAVYLNGSRPVWRMLFVTRRLRFPRESAEFSAWDPQMAYFVPEAVEFLCRKFPLLVLVGTDAASVDAPTASPICECSHGTLLRNGIAILENLRCDDLYRALSAPGSTGVLEGSVLTVFNPVLSFEDARGCSVIFFPHHTPTLV